MVHNENVAMHVQYFLPLTTSQYAYVECHHLGGGGNKFESDILLSLIIKWYSAIRLYLDHTALHYCLSHDLPSFLSTKYLP
jgi:hypothetical protein